MYFREQIEHIKAKLEELHEDFQRELSEMPEGSLYIYEKGGKPYYAQRIPKEGNRKKEKRIGISTDGEMTYALIRKMYLVEALKRNERDIGLMQKILKRYLNINEESVMESFDSRLQDAVKNAYFDYRNSGKWRADYKREKEFYEESLKSVSLQGEKMRSGGEMYIASRLDHFGIPYRYEAPLQIPDLNYIPDFTIMRPRDNRIIYWEHFGKVNDAEYIRKNIAKVNDYIDYGIKPWDNLIITYNNEKGGFNGREIDAMIESRLLY